jgi:hypothetical protein
LLSLSFSPFCPAHDWLLFQESGELHFIILDSQEYFFKNHFCQTMIYLKSKGLLDQYLYSNLNVMFTTSSYLTNF